MDSDQDFMAFLPNGRSQADQGMYVEFYWQPIKNEARSRKEGRDIFEDHPFVLILAKGQKNTELRREVKDKDKQRFRREWAAFQARQVPPVDGHGPGHFQQPL